MVLTGQDLIAENATYGTMVALVSYTAVRYVVVPLFANAPADPWDYLKFTAAAFVNGSLFQIIIMKPKEWHLLACRLIAVLRGPID